MSAVRSRLAVSGRRRQGGQGAGRGPLHERRHHTRRARDPVHERDPPRTARDQLRPARGLPQGLRRARRRRIRPDGCTADAERTRPRPREAAALRRHDPGRRVVVTRRRTYGGGRRRRCPLHPRQASHGEGPPAPARADHANRRLPARQANRPPPRPCAPCDQAPRPGTGQAPSPPAVDHCEAFPQRQARGYGALRLIDSSSTTRAVPSARGVVDASPSTTTRSPQATLSHQPGWLAAAIVVSPARSALTTIEPMIATPSEMPISRLVDAIAAATPAWSGGIPLPAVFVIGGLTIPKPSPNTR